MIQEGKIIEKGLWDTDKIMMQLNHLERQGGIGTPSKILFNRNTKGPMPNSNNESVDIQEKIQMKLQKTEEPANIKARLNREIFAKGNKEHIQDPTSKLRTKDCEVIQVQQYNGKLWSNLLKGSDGDEYLKIGLCVFLQASPETESTLQ